VNIHASLDKLSLRSSALFYSKSKYFRDSLESATLQEHLENTQIEFPEEADKRFYELKAQTLAGEMYPAFRIAQWKSDAYPTIIYHHGAAEEPYDYSFKRICPIEMLKIPANFMVIRAPFGARVRHLTQGIKDLASYTAMVAVSVKLVEHLNTMAKRIGSSSVTVTGLSLGGFVTNIHHTYFNSADYYRPCLAGTSIEEALLNSEYSRMVSPQALQNKDRIKAVLNFEEDFCKVNHENVFPLLGRFDQIMLLDRQSRFYPKDKITLIDRGHVTGALALRSLREHILKGI
jgi:hypothetical protein